MEILFLGLNQRYSDWLSETLKDTNCNISIVHSDQNIFKKYVDLTLENKSFSYIFVPDFIDKPKISALQLSMFLMEVSPMAKIVLLSEEESLYSKDMECEPIYKIFKEPFQPNDIINLIQ